MGVVNPFNKEVLEKLIAADPNLERFFSMKFTEALEKFGPVPEDIYDWADDPNLSAQEILARFDVLPDEITTYDFEANIREVGAVSRYPLRTWEEMAAEEGSIDLGNGVFYKKTIDKDGNWIGINEWHKNKDGNLCGGWVPFDVGSEYILPETPKWQVHSLEPLHLEPSLLCGCGHHGFIRNGQWQDC